MLFFKLLLFILPNNFGDEIAKAIGNDPLLLKSMTNNYPLFLKTVDNMDLNNFSFNFCYKILLKGVL